MGHRKQTNRGAFDMDEASENIILWQHYRDSLPPMGCRWEKTFAGRSDCLGNRTDLQQDVQCGSILMPPPAALLFYQNFCATVLAAKVVWTVAQYDKFDLLLSRNLCSNVGYQSGRSILKVLSLTPLAMENPGSVTV